MYLNFKYNNVEAMYIGFNDRDTEGVYWWVYGGSFYVNWAVGQPSGSSGDFDCAVMRFNSLQDGTWSNENCTILRYAICEYTDIALPPTATYGPSLHPTLAPTAGLW